MGSLLLGPMHITQQHKTAVFLRPENRAPSLPQVEMSLLTSHLDGWALRYRMRAFHESDERHERLRIVLHSPLIPLTSCLPNA